MPITRSTYPAFLAVLLLPLGVNAMPITSEADPALIGSTLIDFESPAPGEYASLVLPGVTINGIGNTMTICTLCGGGGGTFGDDGQTLQNAGGSPITFDIVFDSVVSAFGIQGGAFNSPWTYSAFDSSNVLIETMAVNNPCCGPFFDGIAAAGIKRVTLNGGGDWVVFDNLRFVADSVAVPEPGILSLLGLGLMGMALVRRCKKI